MKEKAFFLACLPNSLLAWSLCLIIDLETWWPQNAATFYKCPAVILGEIFTTLTLFLIVQEPKYTRILFQVDSLQLQMFSTYNYCSSDGYGHFHVIVCSPFPIYEGRHRFVTFDVCVLLC